VPVPPAALPLPVVVGAAGFLVAAAGFSAGVRVVA